MSNKIQALLDLQGRSQAYLCRELNRSANTVSSWCRGKSEPNLSDAKLIADLLGVSLDDLISDTKQDNNESK
jgi:transcriptional regulator with XRE-family HTH domain